MGYSSYYQLVLGLNLIGFVYSQLSFYADIVVDKPNNKFITNNVYNLPL